MIRFAHSWQQYFSQVMRCCFHSITLLIFPLMGFLEAENFVVVHPSTFTLELYSEENGETILLKTYPIRLGKAGMGKSKRGDMKTPIGKYKIIWKASVFCQEDGGFPIEEGRTFCSDNNCYSQEPLEGCEPLWGDPFGGSEATFMCLDYPNQLDLVNAWTGSGIGIHGTLHQTMGEYATAGCIHMFPKDARELYQTLDVGSLIDIREK